MSASEIRDRIVEAVGREEVNAKVILRATLRHLEASADLLRLLLGDEPAKSSERPEESEDGTEIVYVEGFGGQKVPVEVPPVE
jgi:hypothetical protein